MRAEKPQLKQPRKPRVAIGYGACVDLFVEAAELLDGLKIQPPDRPGHFDEVEDVAQLGQMFAYFFRYGAAAE